MGQPIDPVTLSILWSRLLAIVDEAGAALQRTAFSTVTRESNDFAVVLMDARGRSVAQSSVSVPSFLGVLPIMTKALLAGDFPAESWRPGDVIITNDPWLCAGHKPDIGLVSPIFKNDRLIAFIGTIAHAPDIGGTLWGAGARDLYEEGLLIPPTKLYSEGTANQTLLSIIEANVRSPRQTIGDIRAQLAANDQGRKDLISLVDEMNMADIETLAQQIQDASEKAMRDAIREAPDGVYRYSYGADGDAKGEPVTLNIAIHIQGDEILVDYAGTSPAHSLGINAVLNYTYAYTVYPIKCAFSPDVPNNEGSFNPVRVIAPKGCLVNAQSPAPVGARNITGNILHAVVFGALAQAVPKQIQADCGSACWSVVLNGIHEDRDEEFVEYFFLNGGYGARPHADGINVLSFPTNVANVPIEVLEHSMPVMFHEKSLIPDSGGKGQFRGGLGQKLAFTWKGKKPVNLSLLTEKTKTEPIGVCGGEAGSKGAIHLEPPRPIDPKGLTKLYPGDTLSLSLPGGGGYGPSMARDPKLHQRDQELGYISRK